MFHVKHFEVAVDKPEVKELNKGVKQGRGQVIPVSYRKLMVDANQYGARMKSTSE